MKTWLKTLAAAAALGLLAQQAPAADKTEIIYGKSQGPYTELFEAAIVPILQKQGYTVQGIDFSVLVTADIALNDGDVDFNV